MDPPTTPPKHRRLTIRSEDERKNLGKTGRMSGTEKVPGRTCATKILPNFLVNFLVQFASKPLFYWVVPSALENCSENPLVLFVRVFVFGVLFGENLGTIGEDDLRVGGVRKVAFLRLKFLDARGRVVDP